MVEHYLSEQYRDGLQVFGKVMPDVLDAYNQFTNLCFRDGELSGKQKHLIALGISLFSGNEHCIVYHTEALMQEGVTQKEIAEAIAVAGAYGGGTTLSHGVILIDEVMQQDQTAMQ